MATHKVKCGPTQKVCVLETQRTQSKAKGLVFTLLTHVGGSGGRRVCAGGRSICTNVQGEGQDCQAGTYAAEHNKPQP